jgi:undecaprenyl-diphosphatase
VLSKFGFVGRITYARSAAVQRRRAGAWLARLDARDRELFTRWAVFDTAPRATKLLWQAITQLGGTLCTIAGSTLPLTRGGLIADAARRALAILVASHLVVQLVKRSVGRPRPSCGVGCATLIREPDQFSFPSGHAAAAMSVAAAYAFAFPHLAPVFVFVAVLVGLSRVVLGVHYPGDVLIGQLIALLTAVPVFLWTGSF